MTTNQLNWLQFTVLIMRRLCGNFISFIVLLLDSNASKHSLLLSNLELSNLRTDALAVMAVFCNSDSELTQILNTRRNLINLGFEVIVVNNGDHHPNVDTKSLNWIPRKNQGRDFGAWKDILKEVKGLDFSELLLVNDTCQWSEHALKKYIGYCRSSKFDSICASQSLQKERHMQSYILYFKGRGLLKIFQYFSQVSNWKYKRTIVLKGEIGLSRYLNRNEVPFESWVDPKRFSRAHIGSCFHWQLSVNPINFFSNEIEEEYHFKKYAITGMKIS